jgi:hypothetical protein
LHALFASDDRVVGRSQWAPAKKPPLRTLLFLPPEHPHRITRHKTLLFFAPRPPDTGASRRSEFRSEGGGKKKARFLCGVRCVIEVSMVSLLYAFHPAACRARPCVLGGGGATRRRSVGGANPRPRAFYAGCSRLSAIGHDGSPLGGRPDGPAGSSPHSHSLE